MSSTGLKILTLVLMEEDKPAVTKQDEMEYRDNLVEVAVFGIYGQVWSVMRKKLMMFCLNTLVIVLGVELRFSLAKGIL